MNKAYEVSDAQRDDATISPVDLIAAYERGIDDLRNAVAGLNDKQLRLRPVAGKWSVMEVLCHISDCEQFGADRIKRTLAMEKPLLIGAEGFRYPGPVKYHERDAEEELALIALTRSQITRILKLIEPEAWERQAVHSEIGLVTLRGLVLHYINHMRHHLRFITEKRAVLK
jgi:uncharacterized damage-inducible protein DinB